VAAPRPGVAAPFARCVFVNCPFDDTYLPLLHTLLFTIHDCGFVARIAVEDTGGSEMRIDKITRIIRESCYSIHDISRVETDGTSGLPRFNMPFEAGLALGATRFERARPARPRRDFLLLDAVRHRDRQTLSDLAGQDAKAHDNDPARLVAAVREFLAAKARPERTRGARAIWARYEAFSRELPAISAEFDYPVEELLSFGYIPEWTEAVTMWQRKTF